ncbi:MAG: DUF1186 domain-containing protein [Burkholderiales bacterium]|nr:DUF1186 domain-containing protein [Burkholderiales bacterium]
MQTTPTWSSLAAALSHYDDEFPREAIEGALAHPEIAAQPLLDELDACASNPAKRCDDEEGWMLHLYAIYFLASWRDARAFAPLLRIARLKESVLETLLGDHLTEGLPRALAATCPADGEGELQALASDRKAYFWARSAALRAQALRALEGDMPRAALLAWLKEEGEREADRMVDGNLQPETGEDTDYLSELVVTMQEIGASELSDLVAQWFDDDLISQEMASKADTLALLARDWVACQAEELAHGWGYPRDTVAELGRWACFHPDEDDDEEDDGPPQEPFVREAPKVGRNDPCPCGSGKKYKKCCGATIA